MVEREKCKEWWKDVVKRWGGYGRTSFVFLKKTQYRRKGENIYEKMDKTCSCRRTVCSEL